MQHGPTRNDIASGESAEFSRDGRYVATVSKADGRLASPSGSPHGGTSHLRLWDIEGNLIWDMPRSRGPVNPATGGPVDQPASGVDEMEVAAFSRDDKYLAAAGDDGKIEIWQVRDLSTHAILAQPVLARTFDTGAVAQGNGVDSLRYSHDGSLLFAGTEEGGKVEVFRVQGQPSSWQFMHKANHGGTGSNSVNSVDISPDDRYVATAGTNTNGGTWRLDVTRDASGLVTAVNMQRLATMTDPTSTTREIRFQPGADPENALVILTAEHNQATFVYRMQDLIGHTGPATTSPAPVQILRASNTNNRIGTPMEPAAFTNDGRFLIVTGKTRADAGGPGSIQPAFIKIYETAEIRAGAPEPDPVYVRREAVFNTEYLDVSPGNDMLASSHHDGSVRVWSKSISGSETIRSEAFNEPTNVAQRWTLAGPRATADGTTSPSGTRSFGTSDHVSPSSAFVGHRGSQYISIRHLGEATHSLTLNDTWDLRGYRSHQVQFAAAAATGQFEGNDLLRLRADLNGDGVFETIIAEFVPASNGNMVLAGTDIALSPSFSDFYVDLEPLLPHDFNHTVCFQIEAWNSSVNEPMGFDSLRVTGVIPEPAPLGILGGVLVPLLKRGAGVR